MNTRSTQSLSLAQAVIAAMGVVAGTAGAQTLYGGGATLPAPAYVGGAQATSPDRLTIPFASGPGSLFSAFEFDTNGANPGFFGISYCQAGSGAGRNALEGNLDATGSCGLFSGTPAGFSAASSLPDFAASDVPLASTDFTANHSNRGLVQVPTVAAAIAIIYKNSSITGSHTLTIPQICQVFSGNVTDWSQLGFPAGTLKVVYRSDGSGTTFNFSNWLTHNCTASEPLVFQTGQNYFSTATTPPLPVLQGSAPANFVGASGNPGVVNAVSTTEGSIGYAEWGDAYALSTTFPHFLVPDSTGTGQDPTNAPGTLAVTPIVNTVIAASNSTNGQAVLAPLSAASQCVFIVDPNTLVNHTITSDSHVAGIIPDGRYPIVAVTYLMGYQTGNGIDKVASLQGLFDAPFTGSFVRTNDDLSEITPTKGYSFLDIDLSSNISSCIAQ